MTNRYKIVYRKHNKQYLETHGKCLPSCQAWPEGRKLSKVAEIEIVLVRPVGLFESPISIKPGYVVAFMDGGFGNPVIFGRNKRAEKISNKKAALLELTQLLMTMQGVYKELFILNNMKIPNIKEAYPEDLNKLAETLRQRDLLTKEIKKQAAYYGGGENGGICSETFLFGDLHSSSRHHSLDNAINHCKSCFYNDNLSIESNIFDGKNKIIVLAQGKLYPWLSYKYFI